METDGSAIRSSSARFHSRLSRRVWMDVKMRELFGLDMLIDNNIVV